MEASTTITVLLADDHSMVRAGLRRIIEESPHIRVVAEAADGRDALRAIKRERPQVAVVDISMPGLDGLEVLCQVRQLYPDLPVIILTMHSENQYAVRAVEEGARGYMTKQAAPEQLVDAIHKVVSGGCYFSPEATEALALKVTKGSQGSSKVDALSLRELQVLRRLALGATNHEIAESYAISVKTVDTYRLRILKKLNLRNNAELSRFAMQNHLIE